MPLTLAFLGELDGARAEDAADALTRVDADPFDLALAGVGEFGRGERARVLWAGVAKQPALFDLRDRVMAALSLAKVPVDERKFTPHVTLARLTQPAEARVAGFLRSHALFRSEPFPVDRFQLFSSWGSGEGPIYREEVAYPLGGAGGEPDWSEEC